MSDYQTSLLIIEQNRIRRLERIVEKLMQEPSETVYKAGHAVMRSAFLEGVEPCPEQVFKAMRDQLLKEIENET